MPIYTSQINLDITVVHVVFLVFAVLQDMAVKLTRYLKWNDFCYISNINASFVLRQIFKISRVLLFAISFSLRKQFLFFFKSEIMCCVWLWSKNQKLIRNGKSSSDWPIIGAVIRFGYKSGVVLFWLIFFFKHSVHINNCFTLIKPRYVLKLTRFCCFNLASFLPLQFVIDLFKICFCLLNHFFKWVQFLLKLAIFSDIKFRR